MIYVVFAKVDLQLDETLFYEYILLWDIKKVIFIIYIFAEIIEDPSEKLYESIEGSGIKPRRRT